MICGAISETTSIRIADRDPCLLDDLSSGLGNGYVEASEGMLVPPRTIKF